MIYSFEVLQPEKTHIPWWSKVKAFSASRKFEFKPGLNILWGANGSGKSSLLQALGRLTHCVQGGASTVNHHSVGELFEAYRFSEGRDFQAIKKAIKFDHDGQAVRFFDPSTAVGLVGGMAAFDFDFGMEGLQNVMFKGSAGQTTSFRFDRLLGQIIQGVTPEIKRDVTADKSNSHYSPRVKLAEEFLKGHGKKGQPTILLDEPERSYDLKMQLAVWRLIRAYASQVQFIVASHSLFALNLPEANYIEMEPGYLQTSRQVLNLLSGFPLETPKVIDSPPTKAPVKKAKK